ncbi:MAG: hypothetical protein M3164_07525 [Actinomycetota bacterium]|nr:hypothetical protein [Actinomycetota bacterium]
MMRSLRRPVFAVFALFLVLAACRTEQAPSPVTRAAGSRPGTEQKRVTPPELVEYCEARLARETLRQPEVDFESMSPSQRTNAVKKFAVERLRPLTEQMIRVSPAPIKSALDVEAVAVNRLVQTGDLKSFDRPEVRKATEQVHAFDLENCGWAKGTVTAVEYGYGGVPKTLPPGPTSFQFENKGKERHEMVVFRKNDGVKESFDQLLTMPEQEAQGKVTFVAETEAMPGQSGAYTVAELTPGSYVMVCLVPVGSTPEAIRRATEEGIPIGHNPTDVKAAQDAGKPIEWPPPHLVRGMRAEFTVK